MARAMKQELTEASTTQNFPLNARLIVESTGNEYVYVKVTNATTVSKNFTAVWSDKASGYVRIQSSGQTFYVAGVAAATIVQSSYGWLCRRGPCEGWLSSVHTDVAAGDFILLGTVAGKVNKASIVTAFTTGDNLKWFARAVDACTTTNTAFTIDVLAAK